MKKKDLGKSRLLCALISGSLFWPLAAYAAEQSTAALQHEFTLEGVEITASCLTDGYVAKHSRIGTKTDTPLSETAQSISVITREQLDNRGRYQLRRSPGVYAGSYRFTVQ